MRKEFSGTVPSSSAEIYRQINKLIKSGDITRTDRNTYTLGTTDLKPYSFDYSELAKAVVTMIESNYTDVNFTIFETRQFNEFMNLQIGKNTIMVSVESGLENYIFQDLSKAYPGKVLLKPDKKTLWTYLQEDSIIIVKLPTEAPVSQEKRWMTRIIKDVQNRRFKNVQIRYHKVPGGNFSPAFLGSAAQSN